MRHSGVMALAIVGAGVALLPRFMPPKPTDEPIVRTEFLPMRPLPRPLPRVMEQRERLYGELRLDPCLRGLDEGMAQKVAGLASDGDFAAARDLLELEQSRSRYDGTAAYWGALALVRERAGDPVGAIDAGRRFLALVRGDGQLENAAWTLLRELGESIRPEASERTLGVIVEIGRPDGLELIAGYVDGAALLLRGEVAEPFAPTENDRETVQRAGWLVQAALPYVTRFPIRHDRVLPTVGRAKLVFLTPAGPRVVEETLEGFESGQAATKPVFDAMTALRQRLAPPEAGHPPH